jgi:hypothetical protein
MINIILSWTAAAAHLLLLEGLVRLVPVLALHYLALAPAAPVAVAAQQIFALWGSCGPASLEP